jgi:hypothetical protein
MKTFWSLLACMGVLAPGARADDLEPAVQTSAAATARPEPATPAAATSPAAAPAAATGAPARPAAGRGARDGAAPKVLDRLELESTQITGNKELPKVMYVVPWRRPDLGEFAGKPPNSLLDELLTPVDRDVFRRQNRYFTALQPDARPATSASGDHSPAAAKDEK